MGTVNSVGGAARRREFQSFVSPALIPAVSTPRKPPKLASKRFREVGIALGEARRNDALQTRPAERLPAGRLLKFLTTLARCERVCRRVFGIKTGLFFPAHGGSYVAGVPLAFTDRNPERNKKKPCKK